MKRKTFLLLALCLLAACFTTGCASYCELALYEGPTMKLENGEEPLAIFNALNISYSLFGFIPLTTGMPWTKGHYEEGLGEMSFFKDRCTLDNNLLTLRSALREVKSNRIYNMVNSMDSGSAWSLFLIKRRAVRTSCVILKPKTPVDLEKIAPHWKEK